MLLPRVTQGEGVPLLRAERDWRVRTQCEEI
jgi:hypothetical protein